MARIGPNTLVTSDEDLVRKMNAVRNTYSRGGWYRAFKFDADRENMFSELDEEKHMKMRMRVTAGVMTGHTKFYREPMLTRLAVFGERQP